MRSLIKFLNLRGVVKPGQLGALLTVIPPRDSNTIGGVMVALCFFLMDCPSCEANRRGLVKVVSTRRAEDGQSITRQRRCNACGYQWFSVELMVEDEHVNLISNSWTAGKYHYFAKPSIVKALQRTVWGFVTSPLSRE